MTNLADLRNLALELRDLAEAACSCKNKTGITPRLGGSIGRKLRDSFNLFEKLNRDEEDLLLFIGILNG